MERRKVGQDMVVKKSGGRLDISRATTRPAESTRPTTRPVRQESAPVRSRVVEQPPREREDLPNDHYELPHDHFGPRKRPPLRGGIMWTFVGIAIIVLTYTLSVWFAHARVVVTLQESTYPVTGSMTIYREPADDQVGFKTARVSDTQSIIVPSSTKKSVTANATGKVKLFSTLTTSITIPISSKLTSTNGKLFLTKAAVTIPAGSKNAPSSREVVITAAESGPDYNIGRDDLKLSAFPNILVRPTTDIAGGQIGEEFTITDAELTAAKTTLTTVLSASTPGQFLTNQIPEGYIVPDALITTEAPVFRIESTDGGVKVIGERAVMGIMINHDNLARYLQENLISVEEREYMQPIDLSTVVITYASGTTPVTDAIQTTSLALSGSFTARAAVTEDQVRELVATKKSRAGEQALGAQSGVLDATVSIMPPWIFTVPSTVSDINVNFQYKTPQ